MSIAAQPAAEREPFAQRVRALAVAVGAAGVLALATVWEPTISVLLALALLVVLALFVAPKLAIGAFALFLVAQPILVNVAGGRESPVGAVLQRLDEVILVAAVLRVVALVGWRGLAVARGRWLAHLALFLGAGLLSGIAAGVPRGTLLLGAFLATKFPIFFLLALTVPWAERDAARVLRWALAAAPVLLLLGVVIWLLPADAQAIFADQTAELEGNFARGGLSAMAGPFTHPGIFGWALAVCACYAAAALTVGATSRRRGAVTIVSAVVGILASLRRKPLVAFPAAVLAGLWSGTSRRQRIAAISLFAAAAVALAWLAESRIRMLVEDTVTSYLDPYAPTTARALLYVTGFDIAHRAFPLGAGFGRFGGYVSQIHYSPLYDEYGLSAVYGLSPDVPMYIQDTYWPHVLGEAGWLGAVVLAAFLASLWRAAMRSARGGGSAARRALALGAAMVLVEAVVESVAAPVFEGTLFAYVIALPLGMAVAIPSARGAASGREV